MTTLVVVMFAGNGRTRFCTRNAAQPKRAESSIRTLRQFRSERPDGDLAILTDPDYRIRPDRITSRAIDLVWLRLDSPLTNDLPTICTHDADAKRVRGGHIGHRNEALAVPGVWKALLVNAELRNSPEARGNLNPHAGLESDFCSVALPARGQSERDRSPTQSGARGGSVT